MTGFFDTDRWNEIWQTISRNRRRSIMTALGVFWGIFMLIVLLGAGTGLGRMFRAQLGGTATNAIFIMSDRTSVPYEGMPTGRSWELDWDDLEALRKLPLHRIHLGHLLGQPTQHEPPRPQRRIRTDGLLARHAADRPPTDSHGALPERSR